MKKILNVISSARGPASNSTQLVNAVTEKLTSQYPGSTVLSYATLLITIILTWRNRTYMHSLLRLKIAHLNPKKQPGILTRL
jgi:hypothetical protein